jgi:hypothetical protein
MEIHLDYLFVVLAFVIIKRKKYDFNISFYIKFIKKYQFTFLINLKLFFISYKMNTTSQRDFNCLLKEQYKFKNTSLFTSLKVKKIKDTAISIIINGVKFPYSKKTNAFVIFDVADIRNACRDALGMNEEENNLIRLEQTFVYNSLSSMSHYKNIPVSTLDNAIFSEDLEIKFKLDGPLQPSAIDVTETYIVSDIHKETYQN